MSFCRLEAKCNADFSAKKHAEYILGLVNFKDKQDEIQATKSGNLPQWAEGDPLTFWRACDKHEGEKKSKYREHIINLPRCLTQEQRIALVEAWVEQELKSVQIVKDKKTGEEREVTITQAYTWAIHTPISQTDGLEQPHVHLMFSDRLQDDFERDKEQYFKQYRPKNPQNGGCKKNNPTRTQKQRVVDLQAQKDRFADLCNQMLQDWGYEDRVDLSSREARGLDGKTAKKLSRADYHIKKTAEKAEKERLEALEDVQAYIGAEKAEKERIEAERAKAQLAAYNAFSEFLADFYAEASKNETIIHKQDFEDFGFYFKEKDEQEYHRNYSVTCWDLLRRELQSETHAGNRLHAISYKGQYFAVDKFVVQSYDEPNQEFFDYCNRIVRNRLTHECRLIVGEELEALLESANYANERMDARMEAQWKQERQALIESDRKRLEQPQAEQARLAKEQAEKERIEREKPKEKEKDNSSSFGFGR